MCYFTLNYFNWILFVNIKLFKYFNFFINKILAEITIIKFFDNKFERLIIIKDLLAYLKL